MKKLNNIFKNKLKTQTLVASSYINENGDLIKRNPNFNKLSNIDEENNIEELKSELRKMIRRREEGEKKLISSLLNLEAIQSEELEELGGLIPNREDVEERGTLRKKRISNKPKRKMCRCK
jgi:hypothetical protein